VPLYGGPSLLASDDIQVIAEYDGFSGKTEFLIDEDIAHKTMVGNVAAARKRLGDGVFYLFGPHFEHPDYHEANKLMFSVLFNDCPARKRKPHNRQTAFSEMAEASSKKLFRTFLSCLSNARIIALALERTSYTWLIGKKVYDPEKIRTFLETLWGRSNRVYNEGIYEYFQVDDTEKLICYVNEILDLLKQIKCDGESQHEQTISAEKLFLRLREATALFLSIYFRFKCNCLTEEERGLKCTYISRQLQRSIP
jgi:hypothetical protein